MICKYCKNEIPDESVFCMLCGERVAKKKREKKAEVKVPDPIQLASGEWYHQVMVKGVRHNVHGKTKDEYYVKARALKTGVIEAKKAPPKKSLSEAMDEYIEFRRGSVSPATIATYKKKKSLYFKDLMQENIYDLTPERIQTEIANMLTVGGEKGKPLSAKTVKDSVMFLNAVLQHAGAKLDLSKLSLPKVQASPYSVLTSQEITTLLKALPGNPCEIQILLALWLGLRRSEIMALEKEDFDQDHKTVTISKAIVRDDNGEWVSKGTKTAKSARVISCPDYILQLVEKCDSGRLYAYDANYILKCLHRVCEENKLPPIRLHDLRHINASIGLMLGVSDKYMMERNGWSSKDTMVYRYEHTYAKEKDKADKTMNRYFEGLLNPKQKRKITNKITNAEKETH